MVMAMMMVMVGRIVMVMVTMATMTTMMIMMVMTTTVMTLMMKLVMMMQFALCIVPSRPPLRLRRHVKLLKETLCKSASREARED
eukprot:8927218-Pyramimonas_sp.AAC.1